MGEGSRQDAEHDRGHSLERAADHQDDAAVRLSGEHPDGAGDQDDGQRDHPTRRILVALNPTIEPMPRTIPSTAAVVAVDPLGRIGCCGYEG
ncbi:hypothetical protein [Sciscionella marina]|uniref:hypothetical protein n=1 Tax=Sciscionella marina TaxID=508770 RepID=UPI00037AAF15|nr:hypothetical protein [Sciscionella marina]